MRRALLRLLPALVLVVGAMATPAAGQQPARHARAADGENGRILFTHCDRDIGCQIFTANPNGSAIEQVTSAGDAFEGDWSPDSEQIAYLAFTSGDAAIWIVNADGSDPRQVTADDPDSDNFLPRFTPDGAWILYQNCFGSDCDGGIFAIRPDGTGDHVITPNDHLSYNAPVMAPDGNHLAYMRWHRDGVKMAIYTSSPTGNNEQRVTPPRLEGWSPDWSPDGTRIAFASDIFYDRPSPSLYTIAPDGSNLERLTVPRFPHADVGPDYSPDGTKVLFGSDRRYDDYCCNDLFIVSTLTGRVHRVHLPYDAYDARWGTAPLQPDTATTALTVRAGIGGPPCAYRPFLTAAGGCPATSRMRSRA
jgi:Tol biopolymer transport system component